MDQYTREQANTEGISSLFDEKNRQPAQEMLKAICVSRHNDHAPPIHSLIRLAKIAGIDLDEETADTFITITAFNIEARYPDFKRSFREKCTQEFTTKQMDIIRENYKWLKLYLK